jgi:hypothetical protein
MAELHSRDDSSTPILRREVIVPRVHDALAFHRRIAVLSILVALLAGSIDAMLWREAQLRAERAQAEYDYPAAVQVDYAAERAALEAEYELRQAQLDARALRSELDARWRAPILTRDRVSVQEDPRR